MTVPAPQTRADEVKDLIIDLIDPIYQFIIAADDDSAQKASGHGLAVPGGGPRTTLVEEHPPARLADVLQLEFPEDGIGKNGLVGVSQKVLQYSVNTWDEGFMDKLYASTNAPGIASDLLLSTLNTNVHVYSVSPALTLIEKHTTQALANLFGLNGPHAGGIAQPGGSASNQASLVIARNVLFPDTKAKGLQGKKYVLFTSKHAHYSVEKAAIMAGLGSEAVKHVDVDELGRMDVHNLERQIEQSKQAGEVPFYVNATAGTTVLGSYDPFEEIAQICQRHNLWLHVDGSWGGSVVFSEKIGRERLKGVEMADSLAITPHKMLGVPLTCSFLLGRDLREFHQATSLPAGYLFHESDDSDEFNDLGDLVLQCGRRGDALKMFLGWTYYGRAGYAAQIEHAFDAAEHLYDLLSQDENFILVSRRPLPCLQVCFYFAKDGILDDDAAVNSRITSSIAQRLVRVGWMIDYAPGEKGKFLRVVVNRNTSRGTVEGLVKAIRTVGNEYVKED